MDLYIIKTKKMLGLLAVDKSDIFRVTGIGKNTFNLGSGLSD